MTLWNVPVLGTEIWDQISGLLDPNTHSRIALWSEVNWINFHNFISKKATNMSLSGVMLVKYHTSNRTMEWMINFFVKLLIIVHYLSTFPQLIQCWNFEMLKQVVWMALYCCACECLHGCVRQFVGCECESVMSVCVWLWGVLSEKKIKIFSRLISHILYYF